MVESSLGNGDGGIADLVEYKVLTGGRGGGSEEKLYTYYLHL